MFLKYDMRNPFLWYAFSFHKHNFHLPGINVDKSKTDNPPPAPQQIKNIPETFKRTMCLMKYFKI